MTCIFSTDVERAFLAGVVFLLLVNVEINVVFVRFVVTGTVFVTNVFESEIVESTIQLCRRILGGFV